MASQDNADESGDAPSFMRSTFGCLDNHGPDHVWGVTRYPDDGADTDWSEAFLDPLSEAKGRYVSVCSQLEIALFRLRSELDLDMTFAEAEWKRGPKRCIEDLEGIASTFPAPASERLADLLVEARKHLHLRNGVVHGVYRRNYEAGVYESRRFVLNKGRREPELIRVPYDRDSLMLAVVRCNNLAADLLDGLSTWRDYVRKAHRSHRAQLGPGHALRVEPRNETEPVLHALSTDGTNALCGLDVSAYEGYRDLMFEDSNRALHCLACRKVSGLR